MDFLQYLEKEIIVSIGHLSDDNCIAVEVIPKNALELIQNILNNACYVSEIRWWERVCIFQKPTFGYGGTPDPRDPENFYFSETDICAVFDKKTCFSDYISYLEMINNQFLGYDLYPALDIYQK